MRAPEPACGTSGRAVPKDGSVDAVPAATSAQEPTTLVDAVRQATRPFLDVDQAVAAGYGSAGSCVSGAEQGAMGVHYPNGGLVEDPALDPAQPEILVYEQRGGRLHLLGVEYLVLAGAWHAAHAEGPPVLLGQQFHFVNSPNRYGLPAFYELHVWAWKNNPLGAFADFNPNVSCEQYLGAGTMAHGGHANEGTPQRSRAPLQRW